MLRALPQKQFTVISHFNPIQTEFRYFLTHLSIHGLMTSLGALNQMKLRVQRAQRGNESVFTTRLSILNYEAIPTGIVNP